ncbi:hypothetical protein CEXT_486271 [Caerostris extrusa]|uniref:Reverse transcriptase RNase H-like domain-containing protein n=1 Tax=Caerostris extrusa TaxID=172846 RepID=A0AAV4N610_CAEEX|nr:hypothetical protein CEXT_486271 [Caerostris extrusa]
MPVIIQTAVLLQSTESEECSIEYSGRLLISAERNYSTAEREELAIWWKWVFDGNRDGFGNGRGNLAVNRGGFDGSRSVFDGNRGSFRVLVGI